MTIWAAASSIASGKPSTRRQTSAIAAVWSGERSRSGSTARARSTNNRTAGFSSHLPGRCGGTVGHDQGCDGEYPLASKPQSLPAGREDAQVRAGRQEIGHERGSGEDVLEVIEDEQKCPAADRQWQQTCRIPRAIAHAKLASDGRRHEGRVGNRGQRHERDTIGNVVVHLPGNGDGQTRLADAAGAGQGHEPGLPVEEYVPDTVHVAVPAEEREERGGQRRHLAPGRQRSRRLDRRRPAARGDQGGALRLAPARGRRRAAAPSPGGGPCAPPAPGR